MRVIESADIEFTIGRHSGGGRKVVRFGNDAAFLYGKEGVVPCRQRGSDRRLAFVTLWVAWDIDSEPEVTVKEVHSLRVQAHLKALKRRGWAQQGAKGVDAAIDRAAEEPCGYTFVNDGVENLTEVGVRIHIQGVWSPGEKAPPFKRGTMTAVATAVVFLPDGSGDRLFADSGIPAIDDFIAFLGEEV